LLLNSEFEGGGQPKIETVIAAVYDLALNLEYLEVEFYTYASTGKSIASFGVGIDGWQRAKTLRPADPL
jgi:hypothetical protein